MQVPIQVREARRESLRVHVPNDPYVLIVDDDTSILSVVSFLLDTEDYPNISIGQSVDVLPFLNELHRSEGRLPSLILLDLMMPSVSGYDIAAVLSKHPRLSRIPVIIMTADYRVTTASDVPGVVEVVNKPFHIEMLLDKIEQYFVPEQK